MAPQRPSRVVILGASGFVGRHAVAHLASLGIETVPVTSAQLDLTALGCVEQLRQLVRSDDTLIFVSALTPDRGRDVRTFMKNLAMGEHVATWLQQAPCAHVVYVSSDAVYADSVTLVRESSCASPSTFHGLMHLTRARMLAQALTTSRTPLILLRPCAMFGTDDTHNGYGPNRFVRSALTQRTIALFGQGEEQRDHLFIGDLARIIGLCVQHRASGVLNVATGRAVSFGEVAQTVASLSAEPVRIESQPRSGPVTHRHVDITSLVRAFPSFRFTPMAAALADMMRELTPSTALAAGRPT